MDWRNGELKECRTGVRQDRSEAGPEGCRTGGMQDRREEVCRALGMQERRDALMQDEFKPMQDINFVNKKFTL